MVAGFFSKNVLCFALHIHRDRNSTAARPRGIFEVYFSPAPDKGQPNVFRCWTNTLSLSGSCASGRGCEMPVLAPAQSTAFLGSGAVGNEAGADMAFSQDPSLDRPNVICSVDCHSRSTCEVKWKLSGRVVLTKSTRRFRMPISHLSLTE